MRRALASAAALLVAACQVDVEGAICHVPGAAAECPAGQACGNDRRCSERALACETAGTRCEPGSAACAGDDDEERVERCTGAVDPVCGSWAVEECTAAGLRCGTRSGEAGCECPAFDGAELAADPVAGSRDPDLPPFPTGAASPPACRFGRLGDALDAARDALSEHPEGTAVRAWGAGGPVVFGDVASGETFPLTVPENVTLLAAAPGPIAIRAAASSSPGPLVALEGTMDGGAGGLRIESVGVPGTGVRVSCGTSGRPRIANVIVDGGDALTKGIDVEGRACGAVLTGVDVSKVSGPALEVGADVGVEVSVTASVFRESTTGIRATGGKLTLGSELPSDAVTVSGNRGEGILLTGGAAAPFATLDVQLQGTTIENNGGTAVTLDVVNTLSKVTMSRCDVHANGREQPRKYGQNPQRVAGGVFIRQSSLAEFVFEGNRLWSNAGDQLAFETSGAAWSLASAATACGYASNLFAHVTPPSAAVGVAGIGGSVRANHSVWPGTPWSEWATPGVHVDEGAWCTPEAGGAPQLPPAP